MAKKKSSRKPAAKEPAAPTAAMPIVVLRGRDQYMLGERTRQLREALTETHGEIDEFRYEGDVCDLADVLDELRSYGLMSAHKMVILEKADEFLAREGMRQAMERYAAQPIESATLLMRAETWRPGKFDKAVDAVGGGIFKCEAPNASQALAWCIARCSKRYNATIEQPAATLLVEQIGAELARLDVELAKLAAFVGEGQTITKAVVQDMVGMSREEQAWAIQAHLAAGDATGALTKVRELLNVSRQPETLVSWAVVDLLKKIHAAAQLMRQGRSQGDVGKDLRLFGDARSAILNSAARIAPEKIAQLMQQVIDRDTGLRRGLGESTRTLESIVLLVADTIRLSRSPAA
jgi:DNA polymerase-3 subunit delta